MKRIYANGVDDSDGYLDLADDPRELPWFREVVIKAKARLRLCRRRLARRGFASVLGCLTIDNTRTV